MPHFTLVKEALIEIGCVVTSLVGWLSRAWTLVKEALIEIGCVVTSLVVTRVHCGQTVHPRPIVTMEHK